MNQGYLLSCIYLVLSSLFFLQNRYRMQLVFMMRFFTKVRTDKKANAAYCLLGILISLLLFFFPMAPGPMVMGDLLPLLMVVYQTLYLYITYLRSERFEAKDYLDLKKEGRRVTIGWVGIAIATAHFLLPHFVLL